MTYVWKNKNLNFDFCPVLGSLGGMFFGPGAFATRADFQGEDPWKYDDALLTRWDAFPTNEVQDWKASLRDDVKLFDAGRQAALEMAALEAGPDWLSGALLALGRSAVEVRWYSVTNATEAMRQYNRLLGLGTNKLACIITGWNSYKKPRDQFLFRLRAEERRSPFRHPTPVLLIT